VRHIGKVPKFTKIQTKNETRCYYENMTSIIIVFFIEYDFIKGE